MTRPIPNLENRPWVQNRHVKKLFGAFRDGGAEARIVGGAVRNALMSRPVQDIDMAINVSPDEASILAKGAGFKVLPTGIEHGTITVILGDEPPRPVEVTSLRRDVSTDGRHAEIALTDQWEEDARRRDFTINALYCSESGEIFDPLDGLDDILAKRVVFIGSPEERIREDYLRILRFFRFSAEYGHGDLDPRSLEACDKLQSGLERLSSERVGKEFLRLLIARDALPVLKVMAERGILSHLLPGVFSASILKSVIDFERQFSLDPDPIRRLAGLGLPGFQEGDVTAKALQEKLSLSSKQRNILRDIWNMSADLPGQFSTKDMNRTLYGWGENLSLHMMAMAYGIIADKNRTDWPAFFRRLVGFKVPKFPLSGEDLIARGYRPGPDLGAELKRLERAWIESDFLMSQEELLKLSQ